LIKILAACGSVLIAIVALELLCALFLLIRDRKFVSVPQRLESEKNAYLEQLLPKNASYVDLLFPHPYLGYVLKPGFANPSMPVNDDGFIGEAFPKEKKPGVFVILFTGGSAANQLAGMTEDARYLEHTLNRAYTNDTIKRFVVLNGAAGAWHQPQQLILLELYAHVIDAVINMDGFNERYCIESSYRFDRPADNYIATISRQAGSTSALWPFWVEGKLLRLERDIWPLNRSFCFYMTASGIRRALQNYFNRHSEPDVNQSASSILDRIYELPQDWNEEKRTEVALRQYQDYLRMMHAVALAMKLKDLYLIQPVPALRKQLTEDEQRVVGDLSYGALYQRTADRLLDLKQEKIPVFSLLDAFEQDTGTIYQDAVHVSKRGNQILTQRILELLEPEWHLKKMGSAESSQLPL
jgi:hypothetical protein